MSIPESGAGLALPLASGDLVMSASIGPNLPHAVGPATQVVNSIGYRAIPALPAGALHVAYTEIAVANMAGTEQIVVANTNPIPDLTSGEVAGTFTDFGSTFGQVGTDLTTDGAGNITSTAGGVFMVQGYVQLTWIPA